MNIIHYILGIVGDTLSIAFGTALAQLFVKGLNDEKKK